MRPFKECIGPGIVAAICMVLFSIVAAAVAKAWFGEITFWGLLRVAALPVVLAAWLWVTGDAVLDILDYDEKEDDLDRKKDPNKGEEDKCSPT